MIITYGTYLDQYQIIGLVSILNYHSSPVVEVVLVPRANFTAKSRSFSFVSKSKIFNFNSKSKSFSFISKSFE